MPHPDREFSSRNLPIGCRLRMRICTCVAGFLTDRVSAPPGNRQRTRAADNCGTPDLGELICPVWEFFETHLLIAH
jgi:hypothetical protein